MTVQDRILQVHHTFPQNFLSNITIISLPPNIMPGDREITLRAGITRKMEHISFLNVVIMAVREESQLKSLLMMIRYGLILIMNSGYFIQAIRKKMILE